MTHLTRRRLLQASSSIAIGALAGCLASMDPSGTESPETSDETTRDTGSLTDWERSTNCEGDPDGMYDSVIKVKRVTSSLGDDYVPIHFSALSADEQSILRTVTEEGGYGTCDTSNAFDRFVERVYDHVKRQDGNRHVYLERKNTYYGDCRGIGRRVRTVR